MQIRLNLRLKAFRKQNYGPKTPHQTEKSPPQLPLPQVRQTDRLEETPMQGLPQAVTINVRTAVFSR
jgi:hypothetical protein